MWEKITALFAHYRPFLTVEALRTLPLVLISLLMFYPDWSTLLVVKYVFGFLFVIALVTHTIRKVLFPYVDLRAFADAARQTPLGASIVFFGFCLIICTLIYVSALFFQ